MRDRERIGRKASPTAVVVDSQSVKTAESGSVRGYDADKKIKGWKRHAMVDTDGRALNLHADAADMQDCDGAGPLTRASRPSWPFVQLAYVDAGYQGPRVAAVSLAKDVGAIISSVEALLYTASAIILLRRLAR